MKQIEAHLVIDLGNSESRVLVQSGKERSGLVRQAFSTVSNKFAPLLDSYTIPEGYASENTTVFSTSEGETFANGLLVEREFAMTALRPTAISKKHESKTTFLSLHRAFLEGYYLLSDMYALSIDELDVVWDVMFLLPPSDLEVGGKALYEKILSLKHLNFSMPSFQVDLNIRGAKVFPEGFAAYVGVLMNRGRNIVEDYRYLLDSTTLIVDIGAGTTDFFVVSGMESIDATRATAAIGGNNVLSYVRQGLIREKGINLPESLIEQGLRQGYVKDGALKVPIADLVSASRDKVAASLISEITSYFEASPIALRSIENLLVVGGGSLPSELEGVDNLAEYLVKRMREFSPNISLVELPEQWEGTLVSPRHLNILGAGILSEV